MYLCSRPAAAAGPRLELHSDERLVAVQVKPGTGSCNRCREKVQNEGFFQRQPLHWGEAEIPVPTRVCNR